ncbi:TorF family putative porin [Bowmanella sp. Y26]|uniref:TorF family putative porin n=1 Tax=Bowmanella yangjiangensis TaxID=2811230 RepID=UPI001BDD58DC|nr:TorF family putative porin [Bowmanella yangjiangensis]MBT1063744.1 TorF family putative porin [Bowmanella yangjiangensis]
MSWIKFTRFSLPLSLTLAFTAQAQQWQSQANLTLASDYQFRGISQTDQGPAIQGGIDISHTQGWYLGVWGSNIEFGQGSMELDWYAGWSGTWENGLQTRLGLIHYSYPQGNDEGAEQNYSELQGTLSYAGFTAGLAISPDYFGAGVEDYQYLHLGYEAALTDWLGLAMHVGHNQFESAAEMAQFLGASVAGRDDSYLDWQVALSTEFEQFGSVALSYVDTDLNANQCLDICDKRWILSLSRSF